MRNYLLFLINGKISNNILWIFICVAFISSSRKVISKPVSFFHPDNEEIKVGAENTNKYLPLLKNKKVAIVSNHASLIQNKNLVDSLLSLKVNIVKIFSPEHGFRGNIDAGEYFSDYKDSATGLTVISLYGKNFKPSDKQLADIDILIFDIQDVGVRFYTYISTLNYIMEACTENKIPIILLDRPNPNGFYIDGPVLDMKYSSFVGMYPVPIVYGMTIGELAMMINGEGWLKNHVKCNLKVIQCNGYSHNSKYNLPVNPSPNLQSMEAVYLYPSIGLFEGTVCSVGRGTNVSFRVVGHPKYPDTLFCFTPKSINGITKDPKFENKKCYGLNFTNLNETELQNMRSIYISSLIDFYNKYPNKKHFFTSFFNYMAGNSILKQQIENNIQPEEIKASWKTETEAFKLIRKKYLLYDDF